MTDIPIIFSGPMVRALLSGRKTVTRRLAHLRPRIAIQVGDGPVDPIMVDGHWQKVKPGDRLWVRETWQLHERALDFGTVVYRASINDSWTEAHEQVPVAKLIGKRLQPKPFQLGWRSPLHLFRELSRLTLLVTAVKIERLHDITEADAIAEGVNAVSMIDVPRQAAWSARGDFSQLWNKLHGKEAWNANPKVVALSFRVIRANIDAPEALAA